MFLWSSYAAVVKTCSCEDQQTVINRVGNITMIKSKHTANKDKNFIPLKRKRAVILLSAWLGDTISHERGRD